MTLHPDVRGHVPLNYDDYYLDIVRKCLRWACPIAALTFIAFLGWDVLLASESGVPLTIVLLRFAFPPVVLIFWFLASRASTLRPIMFGLSIVYLLGLLALIAILYFTPEGLVVGIPGLLLVTMFACGMFLLRPIPALVCGCLGTAGLFAALRLTQQPVKYQASALIFFSAGVLVSGIFLFLLDRSLRHTHVVEVLLAREDARRGDELEYARTVQLAMLPRLTLAESEYEVAGRMRTATEVGGDYYDFLSLPDGRVLLAAGDATGHGVSAGLVVGMVKMGVVSSGRSLTLEATLPDVMTTLNDGLKGSLARGIGMSLALALFQPRDGSVEVCVGGMPHPYHFDSREKRLVRLGLTGPPLGFLRNISIKPQRLMLAKGDALLFLSDGFHERAGPTGDFWGIEAVEKALGAICLEAPSATELADGLLASCDEFATGQEPRDDMMVLVLKLREESPVH